MDLARSPPYDRGRRSAAGVPCPGWRRGPAEGPHRSWPAAGVRNRTGSTRNERTERFRKGGGGHAPRTGHASAPRASCPRTEWALSHRSTSAVAPHGGGPRCGGSGDDEQAGGTAGAFAGRPAGLRVVVPPDVGRAREADPHARRRWSDQVRRRRRAQRPNEAPQRAEFSAARGARAQVLPHPRIGFVESAAAQGEFGQVRRVQVLRTGHRSPCARHAGMTGTAVRSPHCASGSTRCTGRRGMNGVLQWCVMEPPVMAARCGRAPEDPPTRSGTGRRSDADRSVPP